MRCPNHPATLRIIAAAGVPIAAPSGNTSGRPSPTTAQHMLEDMDGKIDAIVDGGSCAVGVESTIIDLTVTPPRLLRPGGLPLESLRAVLGEVTVDRAVTGQVAPGEKPRAPGMKYRHYAPKAPVTVVTGPAARSADYIRCRIGENAGVICFDEFAPSFRGTSSTGSARQTTSSRRRSTSLTPCAPSTARVSRRSGRRARTTAGSALPSRTG